MFWNTNLKMVVEKSNPFFHPTDTLVESRSNKHVPEFYDMRNLRKKKILFSFFLNFFLWLLRTDKSHNFLLIKLYLNEIISLFFFVGSCFFFILYEYFIKLIKRNILFYELFVWRHSIVLTLWGINWKKADNFILKHS